MLKIGDEIIYEGDSGTIKDIAYYNPERGYSSASNATLHAWVQFEDRKKREWVEVDKLSVNKEYQDEDYDAFFGQDDRSPELVDRGYSMVAWSDGLVDRPDNSNLPAIVTLLMAIQYDKEGSYGSSWKGKGEYRGIMANIDRKYDRLDKMTDDEIAGTILTLPQLEKELERQESPNSGKSAPVGESKIDAIADLANYCLLYLTYVKEKYPRVFKVWVDRNVPKYLADKIPFV